MKQAGVFGLGLPAAAIVQRYLNLGVPAAVLAELVRRPNAPVALWTAELGQPVPAGAERVALHGEQWYAALATSRWIVTNDDLPRWFRPQPGRTNVVLTSDPGWSAEGVPAL